MATIVCVDARQGSLDRYEIGGSQARKTHSCNFSELANSLPAIDSLLRLVQTFRVQPDPKFVVEPPPTPTNPPASAGIIQLQKAA